jgi:N6-L-threonylcarbamoyladenine synthase
MIILGIETSCDETGVALVEASGDAAMPHFKLLGSALHSQVETHAEYGGVYPMLAKREHLKNLPIVLADALARSGKTMAEVDQIAVTVGPGLEPALWTGINFAEELSKQWEKPLIPANHMEGHIASVLLKQNIEFPAVALLISGGHTELIYIENWVTKKILGQTKDDAVGEAFDKVARMLGLPYPGGPQISRLASQARGARAVSGLPTPYSDLRLPRPMMNSGDYNFSFSGLKTAVLYHIRDHGELSEDYKAEIAREFEDAVVEVLVSKSKKALDEYAPRTFIIGGGVAANEQIREALFKMGEGLGVPVVLPEKSLATDNAVMIAMAGYLSMISGQKFPELRAKGNLKVS